MVGGGGMHVEVQVPVAALSGSGVSVPKCKMTIRFGLAICPAIPPSGMFTRVSKSQRRPNRATHSFSKGKNPNVCWWSIQSVYEPLVFP